MAHRVDTDAHVYKPDVPGLSVSHHLLKSSGFYDNNLFKTRWFGVYRNPPKKKDMEVRKILKPHQKPEKSHQNLDESR